MASSSGSGGGGTSDPISPPSGSGQARETDGWDNEEWGSLEEEPVGLILFCPFSLYSEYYIFHYNLYAGR